MVLFVFFIILATAAFVSSLFLVFHPRTIPAAIGMVGVMVAVAGIFGMLHQPFFAFAQVIIYAGAVMVMVACLIMSQGFAESGKEVGIGQTFMAYILAVAFLFSYSSVIAGSRFTAWEKAREGFGSIKELGASLISEYGVPFEVLSVVLVAAMVGTVVLSKRSLE